jgi:hypothetical protein
MAEPHRLPTGDTCNGDAVHPTGEPLGARRQGARVARSVACPIPASYQAGGHLQ